MTVTEWQEYYDMLYNLMQYVAGMNYREIDTYTGGRNSVKYLMYRQAINESQKLSPLRKWQKINQIIILFLFKYQKLHKYYDYVKERFQSLMFLEKKYKFKVSFSSLESNINKICMIFIIKNVVRWRQIYLIQSMSKPIRRHLDPRRLKRTTHSSSLI